MKYDIIGDIHGHARELEHLLAKLGHPVDGNPHPEGNRLIFLGDLIDRGPENKRTVEIVQNLVVNGGAQLVMGNHEYNAICYHTPSAEEEGKFLRQHNEKNTRQHQAFLDDYPELEERGKVINWFQSLPLFLELEGLRIVHACWNSAAIQFVKQQYSNQLSHDFLLRSIQKGSKEHFAIEALLKGPELPLREGLFFYDSDNNRRSKFRLKWWKNELRTLGEAAILPKNSLGAHLNEPLNLHCGQMMPQPYPEKEPHVVFGHYSALSEEESFTRNTACLDFNIINKERLAALRWDTESKARPIAELEVVTIDWGAKTN